MNLSQETLLKLEQESMLYQAHQLTVKYKHKFWFGHCSYSEPRSKFLAENYSVWLDLYPASTIVEPTQSVLEIYANPRLLELLSEIGIKVIHTNPMQTAGSLGLDLTKNKSIDGGYDRIAYTIATEFGTDNQYKQFVDNAKEHDILIAGDIIPGHTGWGADFILALCNYKQYPNLFIMTELKPEDWDLVPQCNNANNNINTRQNNLIETCNLNEQMVARLVEKKYIPGFMSLVFFKQPGIKDTNWSVTEAITGVDGIRRRWIYLHLFKSGQPTLNWLDPSFAAHQLITGDIVKHRFDFGTAILRLDANAMLGLEKLQDNNELWSVGHPLASLSTKQLAMMMRKLGGYTYEENNSELDAIKLADEMGTDLSYDFSMRTGYIHALAIGDASLLKLQQELTLVKGLNHYRLIHAMQNHDNLCYELFHFDRYPYELFDFAGELKSGAEINQIILKQITDLCVKQDLLFKLSFGGVQAHFVELIAARLNIEQAKLKDRLLLTDNEFNNIQKLMLLAVFYNAMQPGIFQISAWDLVGAVHQQSELLTDLMQDGDTRWLCRSGIDLLGACENKVDKTIIGLPKCYSLFGNIEEQINKPESFINKLKEILVLREKLGIAYSVWNKVIISHDKGINIVLLEKPKAKYLVINNFSDYMVNISDDIKYCLDSSVTEYIIEHISGTTINKNSDNFLIPAFTGRIYEFS